MRRVQRRPTAEQREADALVRAYWKRRFARDGGSPEEETRITCEETRRRLLVVADWLREQAEALRQPMTRWRPLVSPHPVLDPDHKGEDVYSVLSDAEDIGRCCQRAEQKQRRNKK